MTAALPMGNNKITGMADPTVSTDGATKNYVDTTTAAFFSTGDLKLTIKIVADTGWVLVTSTAFGNGTIGSAGSGANIRANADTQLLFNLLFADYSDANAPILTSGGAGTTRAAQTNAATAWAANCRIQIGFFAGRALGIAGNPVDLPSFRALGDHLGTETITLVTANLPPYTPAGSVTSTLQSLSLAERSSSATGGDVANTVSQGNGGGTDKGNQNVNIGSSSISSSFTGTAQGGSSTAFSIMQPTSFINAMIKL